MESVEETPLAASLRKGMAASEQGKTKRERKKRVGCTRGRNVCEREHDLRWSGARPDRSGHRTTRAARSGTENDSSLQQSRTAL